MNSQVGGGGGAVVDTDGCARVLPVVFELRVDDVEPHGTMKERLQTEAEVRLGWQSKPSILTSNNKCPLFIILFRLRPKRLLSNLKIFLFTPPQAYHSEGWVMVSVDGEAVKSPEVDHIVMFGVEGCLTLQEGRVVDVHVGVVGRHRYRCLGCRRQNEGH